MLTVGALAAVMVFGSMTAAKPRKQSKANATFTITTTELGRNIRGYRGPVPVAVTFSNGKITAVKPLDNYETPSYFRRVEPICEKYIGLTAKQAATRSVDAVSGATLSSRALIENIRLAAKEAQKR